MARFDRVAALQRGRRPPQQGVGETELHHERARHEDAHGERVGTEFAASQQTRREDLGREQEAEIQRVGDGRKAQPANDGTALVTGRRRVRCSRFGFGEGTGRRPP